MERPDKRSTDHGTRDASGDASPEEMPEDVSEDGAWAPIWRVVALPPAWFRWAFGLASLALVAWVFWARAYAKPVAYVAYLASTVGLYYLVTVTVVPLVRIMRRFLLAIPVARRYLDARAFHDRVRLYRSAAVNVAYALVKLVLGVASHSTWTVAVAAYYLLLTGVRLDLVHSDRRGLDEAGRWRAYARCGWELLAVNLALSGIVFLSTRGEGFRYLGITIFAMAAYAFWRVSAAVARAVSRREGRDPLFRAASAVDVCVAVVAMFALQTAMFASFAPTLDVAAPNALLGTVVALVVTGVALAMVVRGRRETAGEVGPDED